MGHVAVVLSGCGFKDGSEIHESVLCLLALAQKGHTYMCFAPDTTQAKVINHLTGQESDELRNCLTEAARIARGEIKPLSELDVADFDAIVLPGGFGAASNLSTFGEEGPDCTIDPDLKRILIEAHKKSLPIGATCIAPALIAKAFEGQVKMKLTLGEGEANQALDKMGMESHPSSVTMVISDDDNKVYSTPCYMNPPDLAGMFEGVKEMVAKL